MPKSFVWSNKYSVGVPALDEQHKRFFEIANKIFEFLDKPHTPEIREDLILLLIQLGNYASYHMDYEEECMHNCHFSEFEEHCNFHDVYRQKVKDFLHKARLNETDVFALANEVADFSEHWLSQHIMSVDKEYIRCLVSNKEGHADISQQTA